MDIVKKTQSYIQIAKINLPINKVPQTILKDAELHAIGLPLLQGPNSLFYLIP